MSCFHRDHCDVQSDHSISKSVIIKSYCIMTIFGAEFLNLLVVSLEIGFACSAWRALYGLSQTVVLTYFLALEIKKKNKKKIPSKPKRLISGFLDFTNFLFFPTFLTLLWGSVPTV